MKNQAGTFLLVREGFFTVAVAAFLTSIVLLVSDGFFIQLIALGLFLALTALFRNPTRERKRFEEGSILAICDAVVSNIETIECKGKIKGECLKITLTNRLTDSGLLSVPFRSTFSLNETQRGSQLSLKSSKFMDLNEQAKVMFTGSNEDRMMVVKHYVNHFSTPLALKPQLGENVLCAQPYGFMLHGKVLVFLPASTRLDIKMGDELKAGETLIGFFAH